MAAGNKSYHWRLNVVKRERVTADLHVRRRSMQYGERALVDKKGKRLLVGLGICKCKKIVMC